MDELTHNFVVLIGDLARIDLRAIAAGPLGANKEEV